MKHIRKTSWNEKEKMHPFWNKRSAKRKRNKQQKDDRSEILKERRLSQKSKES